MLLLWLSSRQRYIEGQSGHQERLLHCSRTPIRSLPFKNDLEIKGLDLTLPFGLRSDPDIFDSFADLFYWCLVHSWDVADLLHYLDDYFTLELHESKICALQLKAIDKAARVLGIALAPGKCVGPTTCLTFLDLSCIRLKWLLDCH